MSKFIITNSNEEGTEQEEFETPEEALEAITDETTQIQEVYENGEAIIYRSTLEEMIARKKS